MGRASRAQSRTEALRFAEPTPAGPKYVLRTGKALGTGIANFQGSASPRLVVPHRSASPSRRRTGKFQQGFLWPSWKFRPGKREQQAEALPARTLDARARVSKGRRGWVNIPRAVAETGSRTEALRWKWPRGSVKSDCRPGKREALPHSEANKIFLAFSTEALRLGTPDSRVGIETGAETEALRQNHQTQALRFNGFAGKRFGLERLIPSEALRFIQPSESNHFRRKPVGGKRRENPGPAGAENSAGEALPFGGFGSSLKKNAEALLLSNCSAAGFQNRALRGEEALGYSAGPAPGSASGWRD